MVGALLGKLFPLKSSKRRASHSLNLGGVTSELRNEAAISYPSSLVYIQGQKTGF